uniref:Uncharacterized protein n=1 Tax=Romanomermis culicivorax TaxID=13658 RepID=A0A915HVK5_ROMCU
MYILQCHTTHHIGKVVTLLPTPKYETAALTLFDGTPTSPGDLLTHFKFIKVVEIEIFAEIANFLDLKTCMITDSSSFSLSKKS